MLIQLTLFRSAMGHADVDLDRAAEAYCRYSDWHKWISDCFRGSERPT